METPTPKAQAFSCYGTVSLNWPYDKHCYRQATCTVECQSHSWRSEVCSAKHLQRKWHHFYHLRYSDEGRICKELEIVRGKTTLAEWLNLADGNHSEMFQLDRYVWLTACMFQLQVKDACMVECFTINRCSRIVFAIRELFWYRVTFCLMSIV